MDAIRELLARLSTLTSEELVQLRSLINDEFATVDDATTTENSVESVVILNELAEMAEQAGAEATNRAAAQQQAEADRESARQRIKALNGETADETEEAEEPAEGETEAETPAETPEAEQVAVTASGRTGRVARMAAAQGRPTPSPEAGNQAPRTALVASTAMRGVDPGAELDRDALANALVATLGRMSKPDGEKGSRGRDVLIASANWANQYPDERRLTGQFDHDQRILNQITSPQVLTATGGICAPVTVDWTIGMIATADRPLRDGLPSFDAPRGGLTYRPDLDFGGLTSAIGIWTEATDANPAGATKPILQISCPSTETVYIEAVTSRIGFGNMQSRFDPETVAANTDAAMAAQARVADNNLLALIAAQCTAGVTSGKVLGAMRDLLTTIGQCAAAYRNLHRIPRSQTLRGVFPDYVKDMLRIDIAREIGHAQNADWNALAITDQQIEDTLAVWGISPIWHLDGQAAAGSISAGQLFTAQTASAALQSFPVTVAWYFFAEGQFQLLDGGRLDLGVVRDSLLDATNDYELFSEVFETVAYRGFTGGAIQLISTLCANGASAGTVSTTSSCA